MKLKLAIAAAALMVVGTGLSVQAQSDARQARPHPRHSQAEGKEGNARRTPEERAQHMSDRLAKQLNLNAEQQERVLATLSANLPMIEDVRRSGAEPRDRQAKVQSLQQQMDAQLREILTAAQYARYQQIREDRSERGKGHRKGARS